MTINNYLKKERLFLLPSILAFFFLAGCQKQPNVIFGNTYVGDNNGANIVVVDTSSVVMSTLYTDSTATEGTGYLQVGQIADPYFGTISSRAYMQVAPPAGAGLGVYDIYDSVGFILRFVKNSPFYGDTTSSLNLSINQVDSLYQLGSYQYGFNSNSVLPIDPTALGTANVTIAPNVPFSSQGTFDTVKIKMDDAIGKRLFTMIYNNSDTISQSAKWLDWFHGLCLSSGSPSTGAGVMYGFADTCATMRIYYTKAGVVGTPAYLDFKVTKNLQFNHITKDWFEPTTTTVLKYLHRPDPLQTPVPPPATLSSDSLNNAGYIQAATGLSVKLTFPYLNAIALRPDYLSVLRAELTIKPDLNSFNTSWPIPPQLSIASTDLTNVPLQIIPGPAGTQTGNLVPNYLSLPSMSYTYDVTSFIKPLIANTDPTAQKVGIIVSMPNSNSFARAVLADHTYPVNQRITLTVYYISLYPHN
jgi:hypothetical protein